MSLIVAAFSGLASLVQESYANDRMGRAARAVAHAVALDDRVDPCAVIRSELALGEAFDCEKHWRIAVDEVSASNLSDIVSGNARGDGEGGDLVLVRIGHSPGGDDEGDDSQSVPLVAVGLARSEPEAG